MAWPALTWRARATGLRRWRQRPTCDSRLGGTDAWRDLSAPVLIIYLLAVQPVLTSRRREVVAAFARVLRPEVTAQLRVDEPSPRGRRPLLAISAALAVVVLEDGWFRWPIFDSWLNGYYHLLRLVLFELIGWTVYRAWEATRLAIRLQRTVGTLDLFDLDFLDSVGRQSTSVLLIFCWRYQSQPAVRPGSGAHRSLEPW